MMLDLGSIAARARSSLPLAPLPILSALPARLSLMSDDGLSASQLRAQYSKGGSLDDSQLTASQLRARHGIQANSKGQERIATREDGNTVRSGCSHAQPLKRSLCMLHVVLLRFLHEVVWRRRLQRCVRRTAGAHSHRRAGQLTIAYSAAESQLVHPRIVMLMCRPVLVCSADRISARRQQIRLRQGPLGALTASPPPHLGRVSLASSFACAAAASFKSRLAFASNKLVHPCFKDSSRSPVSTACACARLRMPLQVCSREVESREANRTAVFSKVRTSNSNSSGGKSMDETKNRVASQNRCSG